MRQTLLLLTIILVIGGLPAPGQQPTVKRLDGSTITSAELDGTVTRLMRAANVTGVGVAIFNNGKVAYLKTYGVRDKEKNLPLTEDSVMSAASLTKVAFAYVVMQLVEKRLLDLDKPVYQYLPKPLPEYPAYKDLANDPRYKQITARMLLSHTSGFPNLRQFNKDQKLNINFEPGSRYAYSGEGIQLLQLVVETVTRKPVQELMRDNVFLPLGMTRSSLVWESRFEDNLAFPYNEDGRSLGPPEQRAPASAAGSMLTTLRDFTNFMQAVISSRGLRKETRDLMLSPQIQILSKRQFPTLASETTEQNKPIRLSYGLGWGLYWTPYSKAFFKEGHSEGWRNYTVYFDDQKTGIVMMTNSSNGEGIYKELLETLLKNTFTPIEWEGFIPYDKLPPRKPPKEHKEVAIDPKLLDQYVGRYTIPPNILTITKDGNHLLVQQDEDPTKIEIFPESERDFFAKIMDIWMTFETDSQGRATALIVHTGGTNLRAKRVE
ncbi:MAG TPA: serine hydrolase [Acidobacteriota bacterium]|jgi:CubicO group peptidase (beta-lactamase class C family)|nr:serine hydrolase [Acidobacteriota bacterium]